MRKFMALILSILMVLPGTVLAQSTTGNPPTTVVSKQKFAPIDVNQYSFPYYDSDSGWSVATATNYSFKGSTLTDPKDFERVIYPLNDPEANNLLNSASEKDSWGQGLVWGGVAVETAGWTDFTVEMVNMDSSPHGPNMLPSTLMIIGGVAFILDGVLTQVGAGTDRANAVDRYNSVIQADNNLSMMVLPNNQGIGLGLGLTQTF